LQCGYKPGARESIQGALVNDVEDDIKSIPASTQTVTSQHQKWLTALLRKVSNGLLSQKWPAVIAGVTLTCCRAYQRNMKTGSFHPDFGCSADGLAAALARTGTLFERLQAL
jgi:hypothetical protein